MDRKQKAAVENGTADRTTSPVERTSTPPQSPMERSTTPNEEPVVFTQAPASPDYSSDEDSDVSIETMRHMNKKSMRTPLYGRVTVKVKNAPRKYHTKRVFMRMEPNERNLTTALEFSVIDLDTPRRCPCAPKKTRIHVQVDLKKLVPFPYLDDI